MPTRVYQMPPLPAKNDLLNQLLEGPHSTELFVGARGKPLFALLMSQERLSDDEIKLYQHILQAIAQFRPEQGDRIESPAVSKDRVVPMKAQLRPDLWVDLEHYEVRRGNVRLPLRAREAELLRILLRQPRCYVKAEILAEAIGLENEEAPERPVEEIISNIRGKLGEIPYQPKLIRCKRYAGYAIFPEEGEAFPPSPLAKIS